jgi:hypothetical protein
VASDGRDRRARAAFVPRNPRAEVAVDARTIVASAICQTILAERDRAQELALRLRRERDEAQDIAVRYREALDGIRATAGTSSRLRAIVDDAVRGDA